MGLRSIRVLALVTEAFGGYGGIAQYNRDFLSALSESPSIHEVIALPRFGKAGLGDLPSKVQQLAPVGNKVSYGISASRIAMRHGPFDLIFCGHINAAPLSVLLGKIARAPVWLQTHGIDAWAKPSRSIHLATEHSALVTTVSRFTKSRLLQWAKIDPADVRVLPNTIRPMFSPGPASEQLLAKYNLSGRKIILTVSRISKADGYKGHAEVIKALPPLLERDQKITYVMGGDGDGRPDLEDLVSKLRLHSNVRFLGCVSDEVVLALYRSSEVFIMPSMKEGFGIVFAEAAASGLSVIGGNLDGSVDALADGRIGRLINPRSQIDIQSALNEALDGHQRTCLEEVQRFSFRNFAAHVDELVRNFVH